MESTVRLYSGNQRKQKKHSHRGEAANSLALRERDGVRETEEETAKT